MTDSLVTTKEHPQSNRGAKQFRLTKMETALVTSQWTKGLKPVTLNLVHPWCSPLKAAISLKACFRGRASLLWMPCLYRKLTLRAWVHQRRATLLTLLPPQGRTGKTLSHYKFIKIAPIRIKLSKSKTKGVLKQSTLGSMTTKCRIHSQKSLLSGKGTTMYN